VCTSLQKCRAFCRFLQRGAHFMQKFKISAISAERCTLYAEI
jgi:hypothetical protein